MRMPDRECAERYFAAAAARFARRDFLRFALFLWMMPRAAALSCAESLALTKPRFGSAAALRYELLRAAFTAALRARRFADARAHFLAEWILGKQPPDDVMRVNASMRTRKATKS